MQNIGTMAENLELKVVLIHPKTKEQSAYYQHNSLLIKLYGGFLNLYHFIYLLEKSIPTLQAQSLKIETQPEKNSLLLAEIYFDLFTPRTFSVSKHFKSHEADR